MTIFDTFLSHNSKDKPIVRELADALVARGLRPWLDERELVPGRIWHGALEQIIQTTQTAVVLFGPTGLGPWEEPEMRACLHEFVNRKLPVIPVLLPGAPQQPDLPLFLKAFTWVDLRGGLNDDGLNRLEWGITGQKPASRPSPTGSAARDLVVTQSASGALAATPQPGPVAALPSPMKQAGPIPQESRPGCHVDPTAIARTPFVFDVVGNLKAGRKHHVSALLSGEKLLIAGGCHRDCDAPEEVLASAELYDGVGRTITTVGRMRTRRYFATATRLPNNTVLVAGGVGEDGHALDSAEVYHPGNKTFVAVGSIGTPRRGHTATLLRNGRVLIAGGDDHEGRRLSSAELYDPNTGTFSPAGSMNAARLTEHTANAVLLRDGSVLIAGGYGTGGQLSQLATAELYDPEKGTFATTGSLAVSRACHSMTLLPNGRVLVAGGYQDAGGHLASAELYDPATGSFTLTSDMMVSHFHHTATTLPNGKVLVAGGYSPLTELYDPDTDTFLACGQMVTARYLHSAALLPRGQVLLVGGSSQDGSSLASLELGPMLTP